MFNTKKTIMKKINWIDHIESLKNIYKYEFYWNRKTRTEKGNFNTKHYIKYLNYLKEVRNEND